MADREARAGRDLTADVAWVALAAVGGALLFLIIRPVVHGPLVVAGWHELAFAIDAGIGAASAAALWFRRRWPTGIAVALLIPSAVSLCAGVAALLALLNVSIRRRTGVALAMGCLYLIAFVGSYLLWYRQYPFWLASLWALTEFSAVVAWGMYIRAHRQLLASLRERVAHAEATQKLLAEQARHAERTRIAQEMHDVLGHRVSLMALHAGGLEIRPDLPPAEVRETAGLIRSTARQALEELRGVIGVLRDGNAEEAPRAPQPSLCDITRLVQESRQAGMNVTLDMRVQTPEAAPGTVGRDTYRIVREALTNVSKHARGAAVTVSVAGRPGQGLRISVRNQLPDGPVGEPPLPGTGAGLAGAGRTGLRRRRHHRPRPGPER